MKQVRGVGAGGAVGALDCRRSHCSVDRVAIFAKNPMEDGGIDGGIIAVGSERFDLEAGTRTESCTQRFYIRFVCYTVNALRTYVRTKEINKRREKKYSRTLTFNLNPTECTRQCFYVIAHIGIHTRDYLKFWRTYVHSSFFACLLGC
jgi:hypothetical protein